MAVTGLIALVCVLVLQLGLMWLWLWWARKSLKPWTFDETADSERWVMVEGLRVYVRSSRTLTSGRTVVLLHGIFDNSELWRWTEQELAKRDIAHISLDLPGFGRSDGYPDRQYSYEKYAGTVAAVLTTLGIESAVVVGHSMGGGVAQMLAHRHPHLASSLILISPVTATQADRSLPALGRYSAALVKLGALETLFYFTTRWAVTLLRLPIPGVQGRLEPQAARLHAHALIHRNFRTPQGVANIVACARGMANLENMHPLAEAGGEIVQDIDIIGGSWDRVIEPARWLRFAEARRASGLPIQLEILPRVGHVVCDERPGPVLERILGRVEDRGTASREFVFGNPSPLQSQRSF